MNTHADKKQRNTSQSVVNETYRQHRVDEPAVQFLDNRASTMSRNKLPEIVNNSRQVKQLKTFHYMFESSSRVKDATHTQSIADNYTKRQQQSIHNKENRMGSPNQLKAGVQQIQTRLVPLTQIKTEVMQNKGDVVADITLEEFKKNKKKLKASLDGCINKFRTTIKTALDKNDGSEGYKQLESELSEDGRDAFFYRRLWWKNRTGLLGDLERWAPGWSVARTGGLLADLGLALKDVDLAIFTGGLDFTDIMNKNYLQKGSNHVRKRGPLRSDWADDIAQSGIRGNAGPSSTTTQLLHVASSMGVFSNLEVEAMMVALVKFWMKGTKRALGGGYHTAVEVWAPYTGYLEAQQRQQQESEASIE